MNILERFGYVKRKVADDLRTELAVTLAVNVDLRARLERVDHGLGNAIGELARKRLEHETLTEHHEKLKRGAAKLAMALEDRVPQLPKK